MPPAPTPLDATTPALPRAATRAPSSLLQPPRTTRLRAILATLHHPRTALLRAVLAAVVIAPLALPAAAGEPPAADADPEAARIAGEVMEALGGREAWESTRLIRFEFAGRRSHAWDRGTGRHRVEGTTRDGEPYVVIHNVVSREGQAWVGGRPASGEQLDELLDVAYGAWVNDTYWLVMPYKLLDPGVRLTYEGSETVNGAVYDVLGLAFGGVGLTPGDRYWAYVDRETRLMDRWAYRLQSQPEDAEPTEWLWQGWGWYGPPDSPIRLAPHRRSVDGERSLELGPIEVSAEVDEALFAGP